MNEDSEGFFSQRTFNIFFFGVFVFIMAMIFKEELEKPEDYSEDVKKSEAIAKEELAPPLKGIFLDALKVLDFLQKYQFIDFH